MTPENLTIRQRFEDDAKPIGILASRIMARIIMQRAFVEALAIDPTLSQCCQFCFYADSNAAALHEDYGV